MNNPWIDIASYEVKDAYRFKGRDEDIHKFLRILVDGTMSVIYANSGVGKTSLINAGIIPKLKRDNYIPIKIVFPQDFFDNEDIDNWLYNEIKNLGLNKYQDEFEWMPKKDSLHIVDEVFNNSIWWLLHTCQIQNKKTKKIYFPLIIFDQFEEVFTKPSNNLGISTKIHNKLFETISQISSNALPVNIESYLENYKEYIEVDSKHYFKIIFSLRKEYLSDFDYWTNEKNSITELHQNRMFLLPMTHEQAEEVITKQPMGLDTPTLYIDTLSSVKHEILDHIDPKKKGTIEPLMLSVLCSRLFDQAQTHNSNIVNVNDLKQINLNSIIRDFYEDNLKFLEEQLVILFEEKIIDENGHRNRIKASSVFKYPNEQSDSQKIPFFVQEKLESIHIIRSEKYNDEVYVELIHDKVAEVITERKKEREVKNSIQKRRNANYKRFLLRQNPLNLGGRQIWDNKVFSFSIDNSRRYCLNNSSNRTEILNDLLQLRNHDDNGVEYLFFDKLFRQTEKTGKISLDFKGTCSKDGISIMEIETERVGISKQLKIKKIIFRDSRNELFYTVDGFFGIICEYDKETGNEIKRKYICDGYTSESIVGVKFERFNEYGFPTKVSYFDNEDKPCKHIDGNYGVQIEYDNYGNESCRWFLDLQGNKTPIYNGVYGLVSLYDNLDRVIQQYFVDKNGERVFDDYGFHGIKINYNEVSNELLASETCYIDENDDLCNNPERFCVEQLQYDAKGRVIWQSYLDKNRVVVEKKNGVYFYSKLKIGYNESDKPDNLAMYNLSGNIFKIIRYSYNPNGSLHDSTFYEARKSKNGQIERKSRSDENSVHKIKYIHDNHGVLICQEYLDENGNPSISKILDENGNPQEDSNSISKICYSYNDSGVLIEKSFYNFKKSETQPIYRSCFRTIAENILEVEFVEYDIKTVYSTSRKVLKAYKNKKEKHIAEVKEKYIIKGLLNHRYEIVKVYHEEDNEYICNTPLTVRKKYDIDGNVVAELLYDIYDKSPICDESGAYGWRLNDNKIEYLGENAEIANNKYGYAIIESSSTVHEGEPCSVTAYYDKDYKPIVCKEGYHKKIETTAPSYDDLCKQIYYFDSNKEPCDCQDGYARQLFEEEKINDDEVKIVVSFWGVDSTPRLNKGLGYHKREQIISISTRNAPMVICTSFKDENDLLVNVHEGFAKQTCKRYDSFWTLFYYPFTDYKVIRFYDEKDKKVDVDFAINGKNYHAYKFVVSLDASSFFKVARSDGKTLYLNHSLLWKFVNIIWIPIVLVLVFMVSPIYLLYQRLSHLCRSKYESAPESVTIIRVTEIFERIPNGEGFVQAPIRQYDVEEGSWIVKWNNWLYNPNQDVATTFETEFNYSSEHKSITFYNPSEKEFLDVEIISSNIGIRIQDAQAPIKDVQKMITMWDNEVSRNDETGIE